jgi:hypothetical protein
MDCRYLSREPEPPDFVEQAAPRDIPHGVKQPPVILLAEAIYRHDSGMLEACGRFGLQDESFAGQGIIGPVLLKHLEGQLATEHHVARLVDLADATAADRLVDQPRISAGRVDRQPAKADLRLSPAAAAVSPLEFLGSHPVGRRSQRMLHRNRVSRESPAEILRIKGQPVSCPDLTLDPDQLAQQVGTFHLLDVAQVVFDARGPPVIPLGPVRLESIDDPVNPLEVAHEMTSPRGHRRRRGTRNAAWPLHDRCGVRIAHVRKRLS